MKAIMISIRPQWVAKILNKIKTLEIRKKFPSDYVGWVYIYCCKQKKNEIGCHINYEKVDGKIVARFWCDRVEEIKLNFAMRFFTKSMNEEELLKQSCLTPKELENYLLPNLCYGKAIHITKLEIFDKPKEISEFKHDVRVECYNADIDYESVEIRQYPLNRAPQSWCHIEV